MSTSTCTTTTKTATMRPSERVLLEAFPAPPSHIPNPPGPPLSGPPTLPLPPVPGPSRVSVDEQLLFLSSVANRSRRSSKYSLASSHRDSVTSIGSITSRRASVMVESPRSPTLFIRPSISVSSARVVPADQLTRVTASGMLLSDIEDDESEYIPARMPSPFLDSSWRRSKHHHNESISSIDVRAILGDATEDDRPLSPLHPHSAPPTASFSHTNSLPLPMPTTTTSSSNSPLHSSDTSLSDATPIPDISPSLTVKDLRLERRAERTKSPGLKRVFAVRSRSRPRPSLGDISPPIPEPTEIMPAFPTRKDDMTLDELGPLPKDLASVAFPTQMSPQQTETPRTPSPDIDTILSKTPRPALRKAASQSRLRSQGIIRARIDSTSNPEYRRRASEGVLRDASSTPSWPGNDASLLQRSRALSHGMSAEGDGDEKRTGSDEKIGDGDESDSSIDLHTPLPRLMVRDGLLSSNSRLLPTSTRRPDGRSDSVITTSTTFTKTGILKDERDTPMRRVRHRDNRLLKGGIGLTTGLGWSDSEDEDAPSPLTRRLSTLNLSRRSSASSVRTTSSIVSHHRHPLSRSYSSGALIESLEEDVDEQTTVVTPPVLRPRLPSRPGLPPTSWLNKAAATPQNARTSTSSVGSIDTNLSEGVPRRPSKLGRPSGSGFRDSSGSSDRSSLRRKESPGNDRTSSSTTASTLSTGIPSTPRDYDPSMSSPAGFGNIKAYNMEKSLPPLPNSLLKKRPSNPRIDNLSSFNFPRARTFSSTSSSVPSPTSPSPSSSASPVRPLHLPRQAAKVNGNDRAAVPVPSVLSSSSSTSQSSLRLPVPRSPPPDKSVPASAIRPRPRTGTGMMYRTSSGSRLRSPMTLVSSTSALERSTGLSVVGSIGRVNGSRIPPV